MRSLRILSLVLSFFILATNASAQLSGDTTAAARLPAGTFIPSDFPVLVLGLDSFESFRTLSPLMAQQIGHALEEASSEDTVAHLVLTESGELLIGVSDLEGNLIRIIEFEIAS